MLAEKIVKIMFDSNPQNFHDVLWRMSKGNYQRAFNLAKKYLNPYGHDITTQDFDQACAEMNDGIEIEWVS